MLILGEMSRPLRLEHSGAIWHVTSRGKERGAVFLDEVDREKWLDVVGRVAVTADWRVHAYVLMGEPLPPPRRDAEADSFAGDAATQRDLHVDPRRQVHGGAYALRRLAGVTGNEIGALLGVSGCRASTMARRGEEYWGGEGTLRRRLEGALGRGVYSKHQT